MLITVCMLAALLAVGSAVSALDSPEATLNEEDFASLNEAIAAAVSGDTIVALKGCRIEEDIPEGVTFIAANDELELRGSFKNYGTIQNGTYNVNYTDSIENYGIISGGTFDNNVTNKNGGVISGGNFINYIANYGTISGGTFECTVYNEGTISGGTYNLNDGGTDYTNDDSTFENRGNITGGIFNVEIWARDGIISGGTYRTDYSEDFPQNIEYFDGELDFSGVNDPNFVVRFINSSDYTISVGGDRLKVSDVLAAYDYDERTGREKLTTSIRSYYTTTIKQKPPHEHKICGATCTHNDSTHTSSEWLPINTEADLRSMEAGKNYYLNKDINLTDNIFVDKSINLCLNGKKIACDSKFSWAAFTVTARESSVVIFNICDCVGGGVIDTESNPTIEINSIASEKNIVSLYGGKLISSGEFTVESIGILNINGATVENTGGGIAVGTESELNLYSGTVKSNGAAISVNCRDTVSLLGKVTIDSETADFIFHMGHYGEHDRLPGNIILGSGLSYPNAPYTLAHDEIFYFANDAYDVTSELGRYTMERFFAPAKGHYIVHNDDDKVELYMYTITEQPIADNDYTVTLNNDKDAAFNWYGYGEAYDVTDENAAALYDATYNEGKWTVGKKELPSGVGGGPIEGFYFDITLNDGDLLLITAPEDVLLDVKGLDEHISIDILDGEFTQAFYAKKAGTYRIYEHSYIEGHVISAQVLPLNKTAIADMTSASLKTKDLENGLYVCKVTYPDGTLLVSDIATLEKPAFLYGDATGDGIVDNKDLVRIKKYLAAYDYETETSDVEIAPGADATGDGLVDNKDLVRLKKYLAGLDYDTGESDVILGPELPILPDPTPVDPDGPGWSDFYPC